MPADGSPAPFRIYNTLTRQSEAFTPLQPGKVGLYVCGMTVYDNAHIGHARAMVVFDAFVRYLRHRGWEVRFVRNFTDVDDKIIRRAAEQGVEPMALAERYINNFHDDTRDLGLLRPDAEPRVSQTIQQIQDLTASLITAGNAYVAEGTVWFAVGTDEAYGKLSGQKVEELRSADDVAGKRSGADFALWKAAKEGEPSWPSPWGPGRPGWHIECSAMAKHELGDTFDIHGGGLDLVFPHHENEIAQSECGNGAKFANYWMHNGLLTMASGQKMGKSLGNVINIREALGEFPAEALRLYLLQSHYRSPLPYSQEALLEALAMLARLYNAREQAEAMQGEEDADQVAEAMGKEAQTVLSLGRRFEARIHKALDDDFNTSLALGHAFELARAINRLANHKKARRRAGPVVAPAMQGLAVFAEALSLLAMDTASFQDEVKAKRLAAMGISRDQIEQQLSERAQAREDRDWSRADALRDALLEQGVVIMDRPHGVEWRVNLQGEG